MAKMTMVQALNLAMQQEMEKATSLEDTDEGSVVFEVEPTTRGITITNGPDTVQ